mmetsp:Transcript_5865/g.11584  ORF Transcript_5865/g.11584 Transcript_5865/m.11584 type:complete len:138 (-) Transcript_5865:1015-1428(-)
MGGVGIGDRSRSMVLWQGFVGARCVQRRGDAWNAQAWLCRDQARVTWAFQQRQRVPSLVEPPAATSNSSTSSSSSSSSSKPETCKRCGGEGQVTCEKCNGEGFVFFPSEDLYRTCVLCVGKGFEVCPSCNGDGEELW